VPQYSNLFYRVVAVIKFYLSAKNWRLCSRKEKRFESIHQSESQPT